MNEAKKTQSLGFRVPESFRAMVDGLAAETGWDRSDIGRIGLLVFWPEIEAIIRVTPKKPANDPSPEAIEQLREIAHLLRDASRLGVNMREVLVTAVEAKLAAQVSQAGTS